MAAMEGLLHWQMAPIVAYINPCSSPDDGLQESQVSRVGTQVDQRPPSSVLQVGVSTVS